MDPAAHSGEVAEDAVEPELALVDLGLEGRLSQALDRLGSYGTGNLDSDIAAFARSEVEIDDPLQALCD